MVSDKHGDITAFESGEEFEKERERLLQREVPTFAEKLKNTRREKGMTMQEVADNLGITQQGYAYYEKGTSTPSIKNVKRLADALGVDMGELLSDYRIKTIYHTTDKESARKTVEIISIENLEKYITKWMASLNSNGLIKVHDYIVDLVSTGLYDRESK